MAVTVITTLLNEAGTVTDLLDSILEGDMIPQEIVVADGGSTDGTIEIATSYRSRFPNLRVISDSGGRSSGRNHAIDSAGNDLIVTIDGGCRARHDWLEKITEPLGNGAVWVGGFYVPEGTTRLSTAIGLTMVYVREEAEGHFIPSARSMAFTKETWSKAGGFPQDLQFGEDTAFADKLLLDGVPLTFVPDAIVEWAPPRSLTDQSRSMRAWGRGDGLAGLRSQHYRRLFKNTVSAAILIPLLGFIDWRLAALGIIPLVPMTVEHTRPKYRYMTGASRWVLIPLASVNGMLSSLAGFLVGRNQRKKREKR